MTTKKKPKAAQIPVKTIIEKMRDSASKIDQNESLDKQHFGDGKHSRIGKTRVDVYLTEDEYRKLVILGAQSSPVRRPNLYAQFWLKSLLSEASSTTKH